MKLLQRTWVLLAFAACMLPASATWAHVCNHCGKVTNVRTTQVRGEGSGAGAIVGGVLGGVLGHQIGGGRGKDVATVAGVAGGAYVGHQTARNMKSGTRYLVDVRLDSGNSRTFTFRNPPDYRSGDAIRVNKGRLTRR